jgi:hypothetical protein
MADEQTPQAGTEAQPQAGSVTPPNTTAAIVMPPVGDDMAALPEWAQKQIKDLRAESANHRKAKSAAEQQAALAAEQAAKEQGKWQELATAYEPKAKRADELERYIAETLDAELANVPEKLKALVPEGMDALGRLRWLQTAKAAGLFAPLNPPRTDAGSGNGQGGMVPPRGALSPDKKQELAARYGVRADLLPDTLGA